MRDCLRVGFMMRLSSMAEACRSQGFRVIEHTAKFGMRTSEGRRGSPSSEASNDECSNYKRCRPTYHKAGSPCFARADLRVVHAAKQWFSSLYGIQRKLSGANDIQVPT